MRPFLTTLFLGLTCMGSMIYWADPGHRWHRINYLPTQPIAKGGQWLWPAENIDERSVKIAFAQLTSQMDILILGSSRIRSIGTPMFQKKYSVLNLGIASATLEDERALWQVLKRHQREPKYLLFFLDPWVFNRYWIEGHGVLHRRLMEKVPSPLRDLRHIFSFEALTATLEYIQEGDKKIRGYWWDGSIFDTRNKPIIREEVRDYIRANIEKNILRHKMENWALSIPSVEYAQDLIRDFTGSQVVVMIILPPFHPMVYKAILENPKWASGFREYLKVAKSFRNANVDICDAIDPDLSGCHEEEFVDDLHSTPSCSQKVLKHCFAFDKRWDAVLASP